MNVVGKRFLLCGLSFGFVATECLIDQAATGAQTQVGLSPVTIAREVYVGSDRDMPTNGLFKVSMQPTKNREGTIVIPETISQAIEEMKFSLPHWLQIGLLETRENHGCGVFLIGGNKTDVNVMLFVESWLRVNWNLDSQSSPLRKEFEKVGLELPSDMLRALRSGVCSYIANNDLTEAEKEVSEFRSNLQR